MASSVTSIRTSNSYAAISEQVWAEFEKERETNDRYNQRVEELLKEHPEGCIISSSDFPRDSTLSQKEIHPRRPIPSHSVWINASTKDRFVIFFDEQIADGARRVWFPVWDLKKHKERAIGYTREHHLRSEAPNALRTYQLATTFGIGPKNLGLYLYRVSVQSRLDEEIITQNCYLLQPRYAMDLSDYAITIKSHPKKMTFSFAVIDQMIDQVVDLHEKGLIHRDLKIENFLIKENGTIRVTDFEFTQPKGISTDPRGSYEVLSPELAKKFQERSTEFPVDEHQDAWALGVAFYRFFVDAEILPGKQRFLADTSLDPMDVVKTILSLEDKGSSWLFASEPDNPYFRVLYRLLQPSLQERWTVRQAQAFLEEQQPSSATSSSPSPSPPRKRAERPT